MNTKANARLLLIVGLIIVALYLLVPSFSNGLGNIFSTSPTVPASTSAIAATVSLQGTRYNVDNNFCSQTTTLTPKCDLNTASCRTAWNDDLDKFEGTCKTTNTNPLAMSCPNKYLEACGSGTGTPTKVACTDTQKASLTGTSTIGNNRISGSLSYTLVVSSLKLNPAVPVQGIFSNKGSLKLQLYTYDVLNPSKPGSLVQEHSYEADVTKGSTQTIPFSFDYSVQNADCDKNTLDDHLLNMVITLYDENGLQLEQTKTTVGLNKGAPVTAGW